MGRQIFDFDLADPSLVLSALRLLSGKQGHPGEHIHHDFGAEYVFVTPSTPRSFYVSAMLSGEFNRVYEDSQCMILKVRDGDSGSAE